MVALCGSVVAANGCALVTGRRSPLWTAPIDAKPSLSFASRLNAMGCCAQAGRPRSTAASRRLVRFLASRRAIRPEKRIERRSYRAGCTIQLEIADSSSLCAAPVLVRAAQYSVLRAAGASTFIQQQQLLPPRRRESTTPAAESLQSKRKRRCITAMATTSSHAPPGPRRHDLRFATDPQDDAAARSQTNPGLDARRLPDADARLLI